MLCHLQLRFAQECTGAMLSLMMLYQVLKEIDEAEKQATAFLTVICWRGALQCPLQTPAG
jgi:hypothetical protein